MNKPLVLIHSATINNYVQILDEMLDTVFASGLADKAQIIVSLTGAGSYNRDGCIVMKAADSIDEWEFPSIRILENMTLIHPQILYLHTLGLTQPGLQPKIDARRYMVYFLVEKHQECLDALGSGYNCAGVDWRTDPGPHFSCNFWWARSDYLRSLQKFDEAEIKGAPTRRHRSEFWIGTGDAKPKILWDCGIHQYERHMHNYPRERYEKQ